MNPDPKKKEDYDRQEAALVDALFKEIAAFVPRDWSMAVLELDVVTNEPGRKFTMNHRLRNPASRQGIAKLPQALMLAAGRVHALAQDHGKAWLEGTFTVIFWRDNGGGPHRIQYGETYYKGPPKPRPPAGGINLAGAN